MVEGKTLKTALIIILFVVAAAGCTSKKEKVENFISRGDSLMEKGEPVLAVLEYKNALQLDPRNARAAFLLGRAYLAERKYKKAFASFSNAVRIDPDFDRARLEIASLFISAKQGQKCLEQLDKVKAPGRLEPKISILRAKALILEKKYAVAMDTLSAIRGKDKEIPMLLSICFKETGRFSEMKDAVKHWRRLDPKGPGSYLFMAQYLAEQGDKAEAARELEEMVRAKPSDARLKLLQAGLLEKLDLQEQAAAVYEKLPPEPVMMRAKADYYLRHGRAEEAGAVLQEVLRKNPGDIGAALKLAEVLADTGRTAEARKRLDGIDLSDLGKKEKGRVLFARASLDAMEGDLDKAQALCEEILKTDQGMMQAHFLLGRILLGKGELDKAEIHLNQAAVAAPGSAKVQILLARCQMLNKKQAMAGDTLKNALKKNPSNKELRMALVKYHLVNKDYAKALDVIKKGLVLDASNLAFLKTAGEIEALRKRYAQAEVYFQRILKLQPGNPLGYMEMGRLMLAGDRQDEAVKWFVKAYDTEGGWKAAVPALIEIYVRKNDIDAAAKLVRKEAEKRPGSALMQYYLGRVLALKGEPENAEKAYSRAIEIAPKWPLPYRDLARLYLRQNKINEAISRMKRLYRDSPSFSVGMNLAVLYQYGNDYKEAINVYKSLLKTYGRTPVVYNNLAYLYAQYSKDRKELEDARKMIMEVLARHPEDANFLDTAGWLEYRLGRPDAAWQYLQDALDKAPDQGIIQLHCAVVARDLGRNDQAAHYLERAMQQKLDPQARAQAQALKEEWQ